MVLIGAVIALAVGSACSSKDTSFPEASAFPVSQPLTTRITVAPGDGWSYMLATVRNASAQAVLLRQVDLAPGDGADHVTVDPARVAPLPTDPDDQPHGWTPSGIFKTDPPTLLIPGGNCNVQDVFDVQDYRIEPKDQVRFLFVMHSQSAGTSMFPSFKVTYMQAGKTLQQSVPTALVVTSQGGHPLSAGYSEKPCSRLAQLLPSGT